MVTAILSPRKILRVFLPHVRTGAHDCPWTQVHKRKTFWIELSKLAALPSSIGNACFRKSR